MPYFQLSIGPVKEFIATARRVRDLHSGSYILSMLATVGIRSTLRQGEEIEILLPFADKENTKWVEEEKSEVPTFPKFPNRFFAKVDDKFEPDIVVTHIKKTFQGIADKIWEKDFEKLEEKVFPVSKDETKKIWDRQVKNYLHIQWVMTDYENPKSLDLRKNVASHFPPTEEGFKCMLMPGLQELSGCKQLGADKRNDFWKAVWENIYEKSNNTDKDIKTEHLCAIAYIKRRFYSAFQNGVKIELEEEKGKFTLNFKTENPLQKILPINKIAKNIDEKEEHLNKGEPSFYAILSMDGDRFGSFLHDPNTRHTIKTSLNAYVDIVSNIVNRNNGLLIYCGGEDVLALLPVNTALQTAVELRQEFDKKFNPTSNNNSQQEEKEPLTISGAIVYTQYKMPLMQSINRANELLDSIAKEKTGRNALALEVNKPSGRLATWCLPWDNKTADCDASEKECFPTVLDKDGNIIIDDLRKQDTETANNTEATSDKTFSQKFIQRFRSTYHLVGEKIDNDNKQLLEQLILTDYFHSKSVSSNDNKEEENKKEKKEKNTKEDLVKQLINQSRLVEHQKPTGEIGYAAAMIARFIATDGVVHETKKNT
jgi:CRISPR-associated protein Cmr2